jgi:hypothetical protein
MNQREKLENIGLKIVQDTLRRKGEVERGIKPDSFAVSLVFKKGDVIPQSFRGLPNLKIDEHGVLLEDWEDGWCQGGWNESGGWGNAWGECWDNSGPSDLRGGIHFGQNPEWIKKPLQLSDFTHQEIEVLKKYGIT